MKMFLRKKNSNFRRTYCTKLRQDRHVTGYYGDILLLIIVTCYYGNLLLLKLLLLVTMETYYF